MPSLESGPLVVLGDLVEDVVVWLAGPLRAGTDNPSRVYRTRGGSAANVAMFAAPLVPTRFVGRVGADPLGDALVGRLRDGGVDARVQRGGRTGCIVVLVHPDGERTMLPDRGASADLGPVPVDWLRDARWLHLPAYALSAETSASSALAAVHAAASAGCAVSLDASSTSFLVEYGASRYRDLIAEIRPAVLFANAAEAAALGLADRRPPAGSVFVIKNAADPTVVVRDRDEPLRLPVPARRAARDSTGAGDAFAAGYLASAMAGRNVVDSVRAGHHHAARVLDAPGASFDMEVS